MAQRLFGLETEYGLCVIPTPGSTRDQEGSARELIGLARSRFASAPAFRSSGIFLGNGSRFYVDCGAHPELATPECTNPWDAVRYVQAGERLMLELTGELARRNRRRIAEIFLSKGNVDYRTHATWGCHESYLHRVADLGALSAQIIPHLVSRIVFCGAGGFDPLSPGIEFALSPRVPHLRAAVSSDSTNARGIFHTRDESLSGDGSRRLHLLCGESLSGETGAWLKVATTALVVALIDAGERPGDCVKLCDPLAAMRIFSADPSCRASVKLANGGAATALEIQAHFLQQAEAQAGAKFMPPWAGEVCARWRSMLERLRHGPAAVARTLDWAIKFALFEKRIRARNLTWAKLARWTGLLAQWPGSGSEGESIWSTLEIVRSGKTPSPAARKKLAAMLERHGYESGELEKFLALRLELFEIDTRCSLVGGAGIFAALDRGGVLDHRLPGVDNIPHAMEHPPAEGRAHWRGECIRRVSGRTGRFAAEWDGVFDLEANCWLDLSDPFCNAEKWEARPEAPAANLEACFRAGRYAEVIEHGERGRAQGADPQEVETLALAYARLGRLSDALAILESRRPQFGEFHHIGLQMSVLSNGFRPTLRETEPLIADGDRLLVVSGACDDYSRFIFDLYKAHFFLHAGRLAEAESLLAALLEESSNQCRTRMYGRTQCYYGELLRQLGRTGEALQVVETARRTHEGLALSGDLADHSLPLLAKLTTDPAMVELLLQNAERTARHHRNPLSLARILCLRARRLGTDRDANEIAILQRTIPALAHCKTARRIVVQWEEWKGAGNEPIEDYWGL